MARNKDKQNRTEEVTKQSRMLVNLQRVLEDVVFTCNLTGGLNQRYNFKKELSVEISLFTNNIDLVFHKTIVRDKTKSYSAWVNEIVELRESLLKFGVNYEED